MAWWAYVCVYVLGLCVLACVVADSESSVYSVRVSPVVPLDQNVRVVHLSSDVVSGVHTSPVVCGVHTSPVVSGVHTTALGSLGLEVCEDVTQYVSITTAFAN